MTTLADRFASAAEGRTPGPWTTDQGMVYGGNYVSVAETLMTTAGLQAKVALRWAWFESHLNQPMPEGRAQVEALFAAMEREAREEGRREGLAELREAALSKALLSRSYRAGKVTLGSGAFDDLYEAALRLVRLAPQGRDTGEAD